MLKGDLGGRLRRATPRPRLLLLDALKPPLGDMAHGALSTGLRFGELTTLQTGDISTTDVRVRHSKSGKPRSVPLNGEGAKFFAK